MLTSDVAGWLLLEKSVENELSLYDTLSHLIFKSSWKPDKTVENLTKRLKTQQNGWKLNKTVKNSTWDGDEEPQVDPMWSTWPYF